MSEFWIRKGEREHGPFQPSQLKQLAEAGEITEADYIRKAEGRKWVRATKVRGLFDKMAQPPVASEEAGTDADPHLAEAGDQLQQPATPASESNRWWSLPAETWGCVVTIGITVFVSIMVPLVTEWFTGIPTVVEEAQYKLDHGDYSGAFELYARVDCHDLDDETASIVFNNRGFALEKLGRTQAAVANYTKGLQRLPNDIVLLLNRAQAHRDLGQISAAIGDLENVMQQRPPTALDYEFAGLLYEKDGNSKKALANYDLSIKMDQATASVWFKRGDLYRKLQDLPKAIEDLTKAIALGEQIELKRRAAVLTTHDLRGGLNENERKVVDGFDVGQTRNSRARVYEQQGNTDKALSDYDRAIELEPNKAMKAIYHFNRGDLLESLGEEDRALDDFNQAISLDGAEPAYKAARKKLSIKMGRTETDKDHTKSNQPQC